MDGFELHMTGRTRSAGLNGMIKYIETTEPETDFFTSIDDRLSYVYLLLDNWFTHICPQPAKVNPFEGFAPQTRFDYYCIVASTIRHTHPEFLDDLHSNLKGCLLSDDSVDYILNGADSNYVKEVIREFKDSSSKKDRSRFDEEKMYRLVLFALDYCNSFFHEATFSPRIRRYMEDRIRISGKTYSVSKAEHQAIVNYFLNPTFKYKATTPDGEEREVELAHDQLIFDDKRVVEAHPKDSPTYRSVMFIDLIHKFFLIFGLEKKKKTADFNDKERELLFKLLLHFKLYNSSKGAKESTLVTTLYSNYKDYLQICDTLSWVRFNRYKNLLPLPVQDIFIEDQDQSWETRPYVHRGASKPYYDDFFSDVCGYEIDSNLVFSHSFTPTLVNEKRKVAYYLAHGSDSKRVFRAPQGDLHYVYSLLLNGFTYAQLLPFGPPYWFTVYDIRALSVFDVVRKKINRDFLNRIDELSVNPTMIDGYATTKDNIMQAVEDGIEELLPSDRKRMDPVKMYYLVLFISDYCTQVLKHASLHPVYNRISTVTINVDGQSILTTTEAVETINTYLSQGIETVYFRNGEAVRGPRNGLFYAPADRPYIQNKNYDIKNFIAMFCDLFRTFFNLMETTKRKGAGLSDEEKRFLVHILKALGYGKITENSVSSYTADRRYYYLDCNLYGWWRDNEYGNLFLNKIDDILF